jgi:hypothetical protein
MDHFLDIKYMNTQSIYDTNGREIKMSTYGKAWLNSYEHFKYADKLDVETYTRYILWLVAGGITFWLTVAILIDKNAMPVLLVLLAF